MSLYDLHPFLAAFMSLLILICIAKYFHSCSTTISRLEMNISYLVRLAAFHTFESLPAANERRWKFEATSLIQLLSLYDRLYDNQTIDLRTSAGFRLISAQSSLYPL